jgi:hypothetical protein
MRGRGRFRRPLLRACGRSIDPVSSSAFCYLVLVAAGDERIRAARLPSGGPEPDGRRAKECPRPLREDDVALCLEEPKRVVRRAHKRGRVVG